MEKRVHAWALMAPCKKDLSFLLILDIGLVLELLEAWIRMKLENLSFKNIICWFLECLSFCLIGLSVQQRNESALKSMKQLRNGSDVKLEE